MNKKLLTIAIAAAMVAPMAASADATVYGRINNAVVYDEAADQWDLEDYTSRLGVKGSEDLGNGMTAVYQIEMQMETSDGGATSRPFPNGDHFGTRLGFVGLAGGFGVVAMGRQWTPYYNTVDKTDIFDIAGANAYYAGALSTSRIGEALAYVSPNFSGLTATAALVISNDTVDMGEDFADVINISLDYANGPLKAGISYISAEGVVDLDQWGLGVSYAMDNFTVLAQYEDGNDQDYTSWAIGGTAAFGNNTIKAVYGNAEIANADMDEWALGLKHSLSKRTSVHVEYNNVDPDGGDSVARYGVGIRHDF